MTFITIKEAKNATELVVLKSKLDSEGIRCRIDGELSNQVLNYVPLVSVKLQVWEEDMEDAVKVLAEIGELEEERFQLACPKCRSTEINIQMNLRNIGVILATFISAIFSFNATPSLYEKTDLVCKSCFTRFRK